MSMPTAADRGRRSRRAALKRLIHRLSRLGIRVVRRHGLLPTGIADRNGEDDRLAGSSLTQTVMVYFPGTLEDIYQLQQWYDPLRALDERHPVIVVLQDSRTARRVRTESALAAITIARYSVLDDLLSRSDVKLALYVGHNPENFTALRFTSLAHVFLNHGDSDKGVAVSNQNKAYDFLFVPGQASIDRDPGLHDSPRSGTALHADRSSSARRGPRVREPQRRPPPSSLRTHVGGRAALHGLRVRRLARTGDGPGAARRTLHDRLPTPSPQRGDQCGVRRRGCSRPPSGGRGRRD